MQKRPHQRQRIFYCFHSTDRAQQEFRRRHKAWRAESTAGIRRNMKTLGVDAVTNSRHAVTTGTDGVNQPVCEVIANRNIAVNEWSGGAAQKIIFESQTVWIVHTT